MRKLGYTRCYLSFCPTCLLKYICIIEINVLSLYIQNKYKMKRTYYALMKRAFVNEEGQMTDEVRMTYHTDINEIYWFKGKYNYNDDDYYICELVEEYGELVQVENSELNY